MRILITGGSGFIGTNLMQYYLDRGIQPVNLDWNPPLDPAHAPYWQNCDILEQDRVRAIFQETAPTHVVHLAARADTDEHHDMGGYLQNHEGTRSLLEVVRETPSVERLIVTSTQFVCEAGYQPKDDLDHKPFTLYGESKWLTEVNTREAGLSCTWTIIRPTTIWGPWSLRYRDLMFKVMRKGLYLHPANVRVVRSYGYVGNVVWQIDKMLSAPVDQVAGRVFYVGDRPFDLRTWVDAFHRALTGRKVRYIPGALVKVIAWIGDGLALLRIPFPINSGRFRSMTSDYITPMDRTIDAFGEAPWSLEEGVRETVRWYDDVSGPIIPHTLKDVRQKERARA
ncbi:MAG TPA: NAD(P)-dependent oxidoreductase [Flavobacteriales bacterium]|nr:NAD(P)-dependent oxidoreductase [Flavobacteriales bacterium]HRW88948.1 NAD(P)-dependent oxidoreductase [Flavobacteriales bacterium]